MGSFQLVELQKDVALLLGVEPHVVQDRSVLSRLLKIARLRRDFTLVEFARFVGVANETMIKWESGASGPRNVKTWHRIKMALELPEEIDEVPSLWMQEHRGPGAQGLRPSDRLPLRRWSSVIFAGRSGIPSDITPEIFGRLVVESRVMRGMSRAALARTTGLSTTYLLELERGQISTMSEKFANKLADALRRPTLSAKEAERAQ